MAVYLHDIPLNEAQSRIQQALAQAGLWRVLGVDHIQIDENALGRVLAEPVWARISSPHYHAAAMDGFAVRAESTNGAQPGVPVTLVVHENHVLPDGGGAMYVDTGDPLPDWADAVVPIEEAESLDQAGRIALDVRGPAAIRLRAAVAPWSHVRPLGEDIIATQLVLPAGQVLRPVDLGAIAAAGHNDLTVARKPRVAILPTGTELVPIGSKLKSGDILEYNSVMLAAQVTSMGGQATRFPISKDDFELIKRSVRHAAENHDLILLNAGSSAGSEDHSAKVIAAMGEILVHGVAVRPGHPVIMGMIGSESQTERSGSRPSNQEIEPRATGAPAPPRRIPVIGVPGYPVSAALTVEIFVEPLLAKWLGRRPAVFPTEMAYLTRKINSPGGDEDYVRVALGRVRDRLLAAPLPRGAGVISSLVQADGIVVLPPGVQGVEAGEQVSVRLYRTKAELERTILCIGSHDLSLDVLGQFLPEYDRRLVSANVGSQAGLVALRLHEAHLAGSHLLEPESGEYNIPYIRRHMPGMPVKVVALVRRQQGLIVRRGNPKKVGSLQDLIRPDLLFVNRQRGAGTRVLLDYHLNLLGISSELIRGYGQEEYTHLGVAAAVASGRADCGLAIAAAANALDLDFIPLFDERFDLVIPQGAEDSALLAPLFTVLARRDFRENVSRLRGYDVSIMGTVVLDD
jgi:putative molybdopterin biosynthesis protein